MSEVRKKSRERRVFKACINCMQSKRQCTNERPCALCSLKGIECRDVEKDEACLVCRQRKLKCDKRRPCSRCVRNGKEADCVTSASERVGEAAGGSPNAGARSGGDSMSEGSPSPSAQSSRSPGSPGSPGIPNAAALQGGDSSEDSPSPSFQASDSDRQLSSSPEGRTSYSGASPQPFDLVIVSPEKPFAFPDDPISVMADMVRPNSGGERWPRILLTIFKSYRIADSVYENILSNMTPRLLSTVVRVCSAIGTLFPPRQATDDPKEWLLKSKAWEDSARCGVQTMRVDSSFGVVSGLDVNRFWTDMAGLHKEEFVNRAFNGESLMPTSELRQTAKILHFFSNIIRFYLAARQTGAQMNMQTPPVYARFTRNWGRGERGDGVLVRLQFTSTTDAEGWLYVRNSMVVVSSEEYEAARAQKPEACEDYMLPLVGSKSAAELLDPRLEEEESFRFLNSRPEGQAVLERFADKIERDYAFVFEAVEALKASHPPPPPPLSGLPYPSYANS